MKPKNLERPDGPAARQVAPIESFGVATFGSEDRPHPPAREGSADTAEEVFKAVILHPGLQHAHRLAEAFAEQGALLRLITGVPLCQVDSKVLPRMLAQRLRETPLPASMRSHLPVFPSVARMVSRYGTPTFSLRWQHRQNYLFDWLVSNYLKLAKPDIVVAYENSALHSFRSGRKVGAFCVLDAASVHPDAGTKLSEGALPKSPEWIAERKRKEIALADLVICCSPFAAETYRGSVPEERLRAVPLGSDLPAVPRQPRVPGEPVRFVFVGNGSLLKGADLLLDAFSAVAGESAATLTFVGGITDAEIAARMRECPHIRTEPRLPQKVLFDFLKDFDCLVLPSRFDGFGMVVPECMAMGLPAIVSDRVGAKCIIEEHPGAGWIVPCEREALKARILDLVAQPELIEAASIEGRRAAERYTWAAYKRRVFAVIESAYQEFRRDG